MNYDFIIVGAGGIGSAAAYYLAKERQRVLLLEQFELDHQQGSSYGYSRVIRYAYDHPLYIQLMRAAYPLWFALEKEAGEPLYIKTGELDFGLPKTASLQQLAASMEGAKLPYEWLSSSEIKSRFSQFQLREEMAGLYQPDTGILKASKCVLAHASLAQKLGAIIREKTAVNQIEVRNSSLVVRTSDETYYAPKIILAVGSWAKHFLAKQGLDLPLKIMPCQLGFFEPDKPQNFVPGKFPIFLAHITDNYGEFPYGIPSCDHSGVKFSTFYGWETVNTIDEVEGAISEDWAEKFRQFLRQYLPSANGKLMATRRCLYTMTPDKHFIIDRHPQQPNILIAAGFSGHGFKFTTLVGKILADLGIKGETEHDISLFKLSRFN